MRELFVAELRRVWPLAAIYAALHLVFLVVQGRQEDFLQQRLGFYQLVACAHVLAALAYGAWQLRAHRRPGAWVFLLHRPLAPARIAAAVLGAGALCAALAVAVPIALDLAAQAAFSVRVVDARHVWLPVGAALLAVIGQLTGALLALAPARHVFAALTFLLWPLFAAASGAAVLVVYALDLAWVAAAVVSAFRPDPHAPARHVFAALTFLLWPLFAAASGAAVLVVYALDLAWVAAAVVSAFRPDPHAPLRGPNARLASVSRALSLAVPIAVGVAFAAGGGGGLAFQLAWIAQGTHPLNSAPPAGGYIEAVRSDARALLGVSGGPAPITLTREFGAPQRHDLTNLGKTELLDGSRGTRWVFSHDRMRFVGMDRHGVARRGELDVPDGFQSPPLVDGELVFDAGAAYSFARDTGALVPLVRVPPGEVLAGRPQRAGRAWVVLSNRAITLFDPSAPARPLERVELPAPIGALGRVDLVEEGAGYRVSVVTGAGSLDARPPGQHIQLHVERGAKRQISVRALGPDFPSWLVDLDLLTSPALLHLRSAVLDLGAGPSVATPPRAPVGAMWALAAALSVAAAVFAARRARAVQLPRASAVAWTLAALVSGWPMVAAFVILERPVERRPTAAQSRRRASSGVLEP